MTADPKSADEMRMSSKEFDRIMGQALRMKPKAAKKPARKVKAALKKRSARK